MPIPKPGRPKGTLYLDSVPKQIKAEFKAWCARRGVSMRDQIVEMMRACIKREKEAEREIIRQQTLPT